ncbi:MAG: MFS transporter, partial [Dehalococcoidia bacterium]
MMPSKVALQRVAPRRIFLVTAIVGAVIMGDSMLYNVLPSQVSAFGVRAGLVGVLLSANRFVRLASNPLAVWAIQRFGLDRPLLFSIVLSVGTTMAYGVGHGFVVLLLARLLWGVCYSLMRLGGYLVVLEESRDTSRGRLMGIFYGGQRGGSVVGVMLGGLLFDLTGRTASFLIIGALGLLSLPAFLALGRSPRPYVRIVKPTAPPAPPAPSPSPPAWRRHRMWDLLVSPVPELNSQRLHRLLVVNLTLFAFYFVMSGIVVSTLGFYLNERLGEEAAIAGVLVGITTLNGVL